MDNELTCQLCSSEFTIDNLPRVLTMCGHTFCEQCIDTLISENQEGKFRISCPQDGQVMQIKSNQMSNFPKNISLFKVIEAKKNNSNSSFRDESLDMSKIAKKEELNQDDDANELITAINQSNHEHSLSKNKIEGSQEKPQQKENGASNITEEDDQEDTNICLLHQKALDVVCMVDLQKICAKCAIFGKHKGHDCKSIEEIQKESKQYHEDIIKIYTDKEATVKRISNQDAKTEIFDLLSAKKTKMKKEVSEKYKKIMNKIKKLEEDNLKSIDDLSSKTETKMKQLLQIDKPILDQYDRWETESYQYLMTIEMGTFEAKLDLMYGGQQHLYHTLEKGNKIIAMIEKKEERLVGEVEKMIENIGVSFNEEKIEGIDTYVSIYDKNLNEELSNSKIDSLNREEQQNFQNPLGKIDRMRASYQQSLLQLEIDSEKHFEPFNPPIYEPHQFQIKQNKTYTGRQMHVVEPLLNLPRFKQTQSSNEINQLGFSSNLIEKYERPNKKKLKSIKVPEKIEKTLDQLFCDTLQTLDLTNAELGDAVILQICEFLRGSKVKTVKFIRNKLTDECVAKLIPAFSNIVTLNLSQNVLTEHTINILAAHREQMPQLRSVILSQNKIIERKHKNLLDKLRNMELTVSV